MFELSWISKEATQIHAYFESLFYALVTVFLLVGILIEYFKLPLGVVPSVGQLVGRIFVAVVLLHTYPEVSKLFADVADGISRHLGDFTNIKVVLSKMGDRLDSFSGTWAFVRGRWLMGLSLFAFWALSFSIDVAQAFLLYTYTLLYVFSPILLALYVLPQTAGAVSALYRSLVEASSWKIVWSVLATLLWSSSTGEMIAKADFLTAICFCLILAGSLLLTPFVVHALVGRGVSSMAGTLGTVAVAGVTTITPLTVVRTAVSAGKTGFNGALKVSDLATRKYFPKANQLIRNVPRFKTKKSGPLFERPDKPPYGGR